MVLNGLTLPNSDEGIRMYLRGEIDGVVPNAMEKLSNGQMWADACGQIFYSLGVVMGIMTSYSSYNRRNKPIIRDVIVISIGNCGTSFFSGFAVFSIVGYLKWLDSPVASKTSSSSLAFVAFPAACETMMGSNFWAGILGLTLFLLGLDSAFSMVEAISTVIYDTSWGSQMPRKLTAFIVCFVSYLFSIAFCFSFGFTYFDVIDRYIAVYLLFLLAIAECFGAAWMFGRAELIAKGDNESAPIMILSLSYWIGLGVMGPVTVFLMGEKGLIPISPMWGILIFWIIVVTGMVGSYMAQRKKDFNKWYTNVLFYGAYQLAVEVVRRSDEAMSADKFWWAPYFIAWWSFSIKYFVPFAVWHLMMWNFSKDIFPDEEGKFYGGYHIFWQGMGFIYPLVGLLCFFVPMCCPPELMTIKRLEEFANESNEEYEKVEATYRKRVLDSREALKAAQLKAANTIY